MARRALLLIPSLALLLGGCVRTPTIEQPAAGPRFDPLVFFAGHSEGQAVLRKLFSADERIHVESFGKVEGGVLILDQTIREGSKKPRTRQWRIHATGPDRYAGTLSDADGPVSGETHGNRLILRFPMKGGLPTTQWLTLSADGAQAHNILRVTKFGLTIAVLEETITRR